MTDPIREILVNSIEAGLYNGESQTKETFEMFLEVINSTLQGVDSPRNRITKAIAADQTLHQQLQKYIPDWRWTGNITKLFDTVLDIHKFEFYEHYSLEGHIKSLHEAIYRLKSDPITREKISKQLEGLAPSASRTIDTIIDAKCKAVNLAEEQLEDLGVNPDLQAFQTLRAHLSIYRDQWDQCNKEVGAENQNKGKSLESQLGKVFEELEERGHHVVEYWTNLYWNDTASLGEVDLLVLSEQEWIIVEFKSRVYDVMSAYFQNGPERSPKKEWLRVNGEKLHMSESRTYVVTTLPESPFILPIESDLKRIVTYRMKHPDETMEQLYEYAKGIIMPDRQRPLDWYDHGGSEHVILI